MIMEEFNKFNPFNLKNETDDNIIDRITSLMDEIDEEADTMVVLSDNVILLTDVIYLYGELIARLQKKAALLKMQNNNEESMLAFKLKSEWKNGKAPAIAYFNTQAAIQMTEKRNEEIEVGSQLTRIKYAYDATEEKINAVKKKIESIRYEELG